MAIPLVRAKCFSVEASAIITTTHLEFPLLIIEFDHDARGPRMPKSIRQGLSCNAEHFVHNVILENLISPRALYREIDCCDAIEIRGDAFDQSLQLGVGELL